MRGDKEKQGFVILIGLFVIISLTLVSASTKVYINPNQTIVKPGENFNVYVYIDTNESIYAISFNLNYDKDIISGTNSKDNGFLGKDGKNYFVASNSFDNSQGKYSFAATRTGNSGGVSGIGGMINLTFNSLSSGSGLIELSNIQISDPQIKPINTNIIEDGVVIINNPPKAYNLILSPNNANTSDDLIAQYSYYDIDDDNEQGTEIRWYKDGILQGDYNDLLSIPNAETSKGDVWYFSIKPKDGIVFGDLNYSANVTIRNSKPILSYIENKSVDENSVLNFSISATDADYDILSYSADNLPSGAVLNSAGFYWKPGFAQSGKYYITFNVSDGEAYDSRVGEINVNNVNSPPVINWFSPANLNLEFREGYSLLFNQSSNDLEGNTLSYNWFVEGINSGSNSYFNYDFSPGICGIKNISFVVSDGQYDVAKDWNVSVLLAGDVIVNGKVDVFDLATVGKAYGTSAGDVDWNADADIGPGPGINGEQEGDGKVDIIDLAMIGKNYGMECQTSGYIHSGSF